MHQRKAVNLNICVENIQSFTVTVKTVYSILVCLSPIKRHMRGIWLVASRCLKMKANLSHLSVKTCLNMAVRWVETLCQ